MALSPDRGPSFSLSHQDWSLHRKGPMDQARHQEKVRDAIKGNLGNIISDEAIITSDGQKIVKVPMRGLELPRFRYDKKGQKQVGQGEGKSKVGDVIGQTGKGNMPGNGPQAGEIPGIDYYEAELTIDELGKLIFEDFGLPDLRDVQQQELSSEGYRFTDVRKTGTMANLAKKRMIYENVKRNALAGNPHFGGVKNEDLRFHTYDPSPDKKSKAVVIAMRDVSGSMGEFQKYASRSFYFWAVRFLRQKYPDGVDVRFVTHTTDAKEVDEDKFFSLGESGGTQMSSAYRFTMDMIRKDYDPEKWNIYPFHFSDGDNWGEADSKICLGLLEQMLEAVNMFGYGEIPHGVRESDFLKMLGTIQNPKLQMAQIKTKEDLYPALQKFFRAGGLGIPAVSRV